MLPSLLVIILPIAYFAGTLYGLNKLNSDSELVAMTAAGYGRWQLAVPVLAARPSIVMALTYLCSLWLMPLGQRTMKDKVLDIRADIGAAILTEGTFNTPAKGLTVFIRELSLGRPDRRHPGARQSRRSPSHHLSGAERRARADAGRRAPDHGERHDRAERQGRRQALGAQIPALCLRSRPVREPQAAKRIREIHERYLGELFWPKFAKDPGQKVRNVFARRGPQPAGRAALLPDLRADRAGRHHARTARARRLCAAAHHGLAGRGHLRILGYGVQGIGARNPEFDVLIYLVPLGGAALAFIHLGRAVADAFYRQRPRSEPEPEPAS